MDGEIILLDNDVSMFGMRVRIALGEKGVKYEYRQENFAEKSKLLLEMNPIHKKVPVLIHGGKPICESLVIIQYIDEVWNDKNLLMPSDHFLRAEARFWADFIDKKIYESGAKLWNKKGEVEEASKKEFIDALKILEEKLGDKPYFGGEEFGFLDVALISYSPWFYTFETFGKFKVYIECPKIGAWVKRCMLKETVSKSLANPQKVYEFVLYLRKKRGIQ